MRKYRTAVIMLTVLAALTWCYGLMKQHDELQTDIPLIAAPSGIIELEIVKAGKRLSFEKSNGSWFVTGFPGCHLDQEKIHLLEDTLAHLTASRMIGKDKGDYHLYSLDNPGMNIRIKTRDGRTETLFIGSETSSRTEYYVRNGNGVFTCSKQKLDPFQNDISAYRDRHLYTENPDVNFVQVDDGRQQYLIGKDRNGKWRFFAPIKVAVRGGAVKDLLEDIIQMRIKNFIAKPIHNLGEYGLDHPVFVIKVGNAKGKTETLRFGTMNSSKQEIYVQLGRNREIYTISADAFRPEVFKIGSLLDVEPLSLGIDEVQKISITEQGKTVELDRLASRPEEERFTLSGKIVKNEDFNTFYLNIMAISAAGYDSANKAGGSEMTIVLKRKGNPDLRADFSKRDQNTFYMTINGKPLPYYVAAEKIKLVQKWLQKVQTGINEI